MPYYGKLVLSRMDATRVIDGNQNVTLGENVEIGPWVVIDATCGKVEIGDNVVIEEGALIRTIRYGKKKKPITGSVKIGDNCVIGAYSVINPGSVIPDGTKVEPHSVVNRSKTQE